MIYPNNFELKIGFDVVRADISRHAFSPMGVELVKGMSFSSDFDIVESQLAAVNEMLSIVSLGDELPLGNIRDVRDVVSKLHIPGTYPTIQQVIDLRKMLQSFSDIRAFFEKLSADDEKSHSELLKLVEPMATFPVLITAIDRIIDHFGNVRDNASPMLSEIRVRMRGMDNTINSAMRRVMSKASAEGWIDKDVAPSIRDGRLVIPVSPMHKRKIQGIVHDESATGKTVYIEPAEVVEANNILRALQIDEKREIIRILSSLADQIRPHTDEILSASDISGHIDFIHAKALYAKEVGALMPCLSDAPEMEWYHALHPVLLKTLSKQGKEVVPLDITLNQSNRILVISGPNAGGKSVCLKTVGINQYMAQCGVLPVIYDNSHLGIFTDIFIDIGDDQSLENDLSTYSSHLANMKAILKNGRVSSLILIDEFGSGTEPQIGAAIAQSILKRFNDMGIWGVVTTHYQNLKHFAEDTDGLINGSMLYDRQLMRPLFKLSIGSPGSSFAIEIARKTGLPADIINDAEQIVGSDYVNMDKYLLDVARDKRYWENKRAAIRKKEKQLEETIARYESDADVLREKRREIITEARSEAKRIIEGTNATIERTIHEIRKSQADKELTLAARKEMTADLQQIVEGKMSENRLLKKAPKPKKHKSAATAATNKNHVITAGDNVKLDGEGQVGKVLSIDGSKATVAFGNLKTSVAINRLVYTTSSIKFSSTTPTITSSVSDDNRTRQLNFKQDIDVRGMRADEAIQAVTYFLDDAIQFNIGRVRILHGTGTGALRQAIRSYLATLPGVASFRDEHVQFGGTGITVVDLK